MLMEGSWKQWEGNPGVKAAEFAAEVKTAIDADR